MWWKLGECSASGWMSKGARSWPSKSSRAASEVSSAMSGYIEDNQLMSFYSNR